MKAAVYYGPRDVRVETVPRPSAGPGEVVLRVRRCSVCGTDKRIFTHGQKNVIPPTITGHEIVGTVHEAGSGVDAEIAIGMNVVVATVVATEVATVVATVVVIASDSEATQTWASSAQPDLGRFALLAMTGSVI